MVYSNKNEILRDFEYLIKNSSVEYLLLSKPYSGVVDKYQNMLNKYDDKFILKFFHSLIKEFGLKTSSWKSEVSPAKLPALILVPNQGLKICIEITPDGLYKTENANGIEYIKELPKGIKVLEFYPPIIEENKSITASEMFKTVALQQKKYVVYAIIASLSINIFAIVTSLYSMQVYDRVIPTGGVSTLISLSIGAFIAIFLEFILKISRTSILDQANKRMDTQYSYQVFNRFLKIRCDAMPKSIGMLSGQLQSYASVRAFISSFIMFVIIDFPFALFFLSIIIIIGGLELGVIVFAFLIISVLSGMLYRDKIDKLIQTSTMASYKKLGLLVETLENAESIKATYNGWKIETKWNNFTNDNIEDDLKIKHFGEVSTYITAFIQQISYILLIGTGAYLVSSTDKGLTMGSLIAVSILSGRVLSPIAAIPNLFVSWGRAKISIKDLNNLFSLPQDNSGVKRALNPVITNAELVCNNIKFAYNEEAGILRTKLLRIAQGEKIGILGTIGSGKSTLLKILAGLYKVKEGVVTLNGVDIQQISREKISQTIGYLPQNVKLLSGTLRDNLTLGIIGVNDEKIIEASKQSGLIHLINVLPQGLDSPIPDGSESVSSGQRQLIGLTRLILLNPKIWLLDEPTANIDDMNERLILNFLNTNLENKTLIIISHKQSSFAIANRLIVMSQNEIVLDGNKNEVISILSQQNIKR